MAWPSLFRRKAAADPSLAAAARQGLHQASRRQAAAGAGGPEVEEARVRARRRLIGATVLLGIGVIAFPLLFETEPRPIPVDLPIEIPRPDAVPPLVTPGGSGTAAATVAAPPPPSSTPPATAASSTPATTASPTPAPTLTPAPAAGPPALAAEETARPPARDPAPASAPPPAAPTPRDDGARARALLEGRPAAPPAPAASAPPAAAAASAAPAAPAPAPRFVVQVGAYADEGAVRAVRARVERLGLPTYTQVVRVDAGERTRVRVGPFDGRDEAEQVAERLKQAGLPAAVLRL